ncbi:MAG: apolipoprotein N-acyltransferase [Balneolales bacterium]|nr:apolipoprotein N-acyltransferase [Balneolales bacterium]
MKSGINNTLNRVYASNWGAGLLAGLLLSLSFSPVNMALLAIPAFMLFIRISDRCESMRQVMYVTFPGFLLWNAITTYWLTYATLAGGLAAIVANAVIMTIPLAVIHLIRKRSGLSLVFGAIYVASAWVAYEYLHLRWDLAWPWLVVGNAFSNFPILVQYIEVTGALGISFWVVFSAALLQSKSGFSAKSLALVAILPVISMVTYISYTPQTDEYVEVVVAQPNYDSYLTAGGFRSTDEALESIIALTDSVVTPNTKAIFWPENAIRSPIYSTTMQHPTGRLLAESRQWAAPLISGGSWYRYYDANDIPRVHRTSVDGINFNVYNAAIGFYPDGSMQFYEKAKLVPIVERLPFVDFFGRFENPWIDWGDVSGYGKGREVVNFPVHTTLSPALVCYDSVFPDWVRRHVRDGAGFVTIITNDGWWGKTSGHIQHFDFARLRAIETRRAVVRSANNGISGMIDANGAVLSKTKYWVRDAKALNVPVYHRTTIYTRFGDWVGLLSVFMTAFMIAFSLTRKQS